MKTSIWICIAIMSIAAFCIWPCRLVAFVALMVISFFSPTGEVDKY